MIPASEKSASTPARAPIATVRAIAAVVDASSGAWLLVCGHGDAHWHLPGGAVDDDEAPSQALRRELREELGLTVPALHEGACTWTATAAGRPPQINVVFWTELRETRPSLRPDPGEIAECRWVSPDAVPALVGPGDQQRARLLRSGIAYGERRP